VKVKCCVGYRVSFGMRGVVLCKSRDVKIVQDAAGVFNTGVNDNGGVGEKRASIYSSSWDLIHILRSVG